MDFSKYDFSTPMLRKMQKRATEMGNSKYHSILGDFIRFSNQRGELTYGQKGFAASIYVSLSDTAMERFRTWKHDMVSNAELREKVEVVCHYYLSTGYHRSTASRCLEFLKGDSGDLPTWNRFYSMMNNDYANNVWQSHKAEPKFAVGDLVQLRANAKSYRSSSFVGHRDSQVGSWMVISIGKSNITTSHKYNEKLGGTKKYELLEVGGTRVFDVMEKDLKKHRVPKTKKRT